MLKKILWTIVLVLLLGLLAQLALREYKLRRDESAINQLLLSHGARFHSVRIYRTKADYNLLEGQVASSNDVAFLEKELVRLNIQRCVFAVLVAEEKKAEQATPPLK